LSAPSTGSVGEILTIDLEDMADREEVDSVRLNGGSIVGSDPVGLRGNRSFQVRWTSHGPKNLQVVVVNRHSETYPSDKKTSTKSVRIEIEADDSPVCGDGVIEGDEECDGGAGCDALCELRAPSCGLISGAVLPLTGFWDTVNASGTLFTGRIEMSGAIWSGLILSGIERGGISRDFQFGLSGGDFVTGFRFGTTGQKS
jgi:hypothetical protein